MKSDRKPPIVKSPMRIQPRRALRSGLTPIRAPGYSAKTQIPNPGSIMKEEEIRPEYQTISCELKALAKMAEVQFRSGGGSANSAKLGTASSSLFERGRFYNEYSAKRNERLRKKKLSEVDAAAAAAETKPIYSLGVKVESTKRRDSKRQIESLKKSVSATYSADRSEHPRYALRSMKKPPLPVPMSLNVDKPTAMEKKTRGSRACK